MVNVGKFCYVAIAFAVARYVGIKQVKQVVELFPLVGLACLLSKVPYLR